MKVGLKSWSELLFALMFAALLSACASGGLNRAPVEERAASAKPSRSASSPAAAPVPSVSMPAPGVPGGVVTTATDNAGKPGYYTVKPGDTLIRIGLDNGQNWRDVARWNSIDNPNLIEVGQVLRVAPPAVATESAGAMTRPVAAATPAMTRPPETRPGAANVPSAPASAASTLSATPTPGVMAAPRAADDDLGWGWPASGAVAAGFEEGKSKGLVITGKAGDAVLAAADGRVVYAGSGLRGYGNLIIIKHNETYLTAYAHNQALLVKDDQAVRRGQRIADMGASDAERVQLHFEIRRLGKPIDPARLLPQR